MSQRIQDAEFFSHLIRRKTPSSLAASQPAEHAGVSMCFMFAFQHTGVHVLLLSRSLTCSCKFGFLGNRRKQKLSFTPPPPFISATHGQCASVRFFCLISFHLSQAKCKVDLKHLVLLGGVKFYIVKYSKYVLHVNVSPILDNECLESLKRREKLQATSKQRTCETEAWTLFHPTTSGLWKLFLASLPSPSLLSPGGEKLPLSCVKASVYCRESNAIPNSWELVSRSLLTKPFQ